MNTLPHAILWISLTALGAPELQDARQATWKRIAPYFSPPEKSEAGFGAYRSPLIFDDGSRVKDAAAWKRRRGEILDYWHDVLGAWPEIISQPQVEKLNEKRRENFLQRRIRFNITPQHRTEGYLLVPDGADPRPAILVVYYEPETGIGLGKEHRDFALQLARRGFVTLSMGHQASLYYPNKQAAKLQPISALAYAAANAYHVLAASGDVDPDRVGIVGHSYGGKWAMFASCLYDKFACAAWSDGGVVFDERRPNVNYWDPWYLGYEAGGTRRRGTPSPDHPRTGAYKKLVEEGRDLHELHALMAPRPFLVSGGSEDRPERWKPLRHAVAVNELLGCKNRVAMTNRKEHSPNAISNEQIYVFFEYFLKTSGKHNPRGPQ